LLGSTHWGGSFKKNKNLRTLRYRCWGRWWLCRAARGRRPAIGRCRRRSSLRAPRAISCARRRRQTGNSTTTRRLPTVEHRRAAAVVARGKEGGKERGTAQASHGAWAHAFAAFMKPTRRLKRPISTDAAPDDSRQAALRKAEPKRLRETRVNNVLSVVIVVHMVMFLILESRTRGSG